MATGEELVFVYGTLRRGFTNQGRDILDLHGTTVGEGTVRGRLYDLGSFPALVVDDTDEDVVGEVHRLTEEPGTALARLDRYEGAAGPGPAPYRRERHTVHLEDGREVEAWMYVWTEPVDDLEPIRNGDYVAYVEATGDGG